MVTPPQPDLFDTHVHLDGLAASGQSLEDVMARAQAAGVRRMLAVGASIESSRFAAAAAARFPSVVFASAGQDRDCAANPAPLDELRAAGSARQIVAVGEIGLDFHYAPETAAAQRRLFASQLDLAVELGLPVLVHSREADADTLALLRDHARRWHGDPGHIGVLHCFTGSAAFADQLLALGFLISFSGIATFRNADALRAVAAAVPDERLLIETDSPYLAPVPHRGRPNEPALLPAVAAVLASVRGCDAYAIAALTTRNAERLFGLGK